MKERISCFDIDGTLSKGMLFIPLVSSEHASGHLNDDSFARIQELLVAYKSGRLEYEDAVEELLWAHAEGLRGENHQDLRAHAERFLELHEKELFYRFGREVIQVLKTERKLFVVTAEPQYLAQAVADMYDLQGCLSSIYTESEGVFTGRVERSLAHRTAKSSILQNYEIEYAFGDSEGDIDMLASANHQYCISPTEGLAAVAKQQNWRIFDGNDTRGIVADIAKMIH